MYAWDLSFLHKKVPGDSRTLHMESAQHIKLLNSPSKVTQQNLCLGFLGGKLMELIWL